MVYARSSASWRHSRQLCFQWVLIDSGKSNRTQLDPTIFKRIQHHMTSGLICAFETGAVNCTSDALKGRSQYLTKQVDTFLCHFAAKTARGQQQEDKQWWGVHTALTLSCVLRTSSKAALNVWVKQILWCVVYIVQYIKTVEYKAITLGGRIQSILHAWPVLLYFKLNKLLFGYFDPEIVFIDNENKYFSGWPNWYFG